MRVSAVKFLLKVLVVCSVCVVCGCVTRQYYRLYTGQQRGSDDVAVLYIGGGIRVQNVNEHTPGYLSLGQIGKAWSYPAVIELLPGTYRITVSYAKDSFLVKQPATVVTLGAKAGHSYILGAVVYVRNAQVKAWRAVIVDEGVGYDGGVRPGAGIQGARSVRVAYAVGDAPHASGLAARTDQTGFLVPAG